MQKSKSRKYGRLRELMRHYRETLGLRPIDCVKGLQGLSAARWTEIESGRAVPSLHDGVVLAARLGVSVSELLEAKTENDL